MKRRLAYLAAAGHMLTVDPPEGDQGGGGDPDPGNRPTGGDDKGKTFTQAEVDAVVLKRAERVAADKYGDYGDLKAKAKRFDDLEEASKTEAQRQADRLAALEAENASIRAESLRLRVASQHGISTDDAELFLTGTDEDTLTRQAERLAAREEARVAAVAAEEAEQRRNGNTVLREGHGMDNHDDQNTVALGILGFGT